MPKNELPAPAGASHAPRTATDTLERHRPALSYHTLFDHDSCGTCGTDRCVGVSVAPSGGTATERALVRLHASIVAGLTDEELGWKVGAYANTPWQHRDLRYGVASQAALREAARRGI